MDKREEIILTTEEIKQMLDGNLFWIDLQKRLSGEETDIGFKNSKIDTERNEDFGPEIDKIYSGLTWSKQERNLPLQIYNEEPEQEQEQMYGRVDVQKQNNEIDLESISFPMPIQKERPELESEYELELEQEEVLLDQEDKVFRQGLDMFLLGMNPKEGQGRQRLEGRFVISLISGIGLLTVVSWVYFVFYV